MWIVQAQAWIICPSTHLLHLTDPLMPDGVKLAELGVKEKGESSLLFTHMSLEKVNSPLWFQVSYLGQKVF